MSRHFGLSHYLLDNGATLLSFDTEAQRKRRKRRVVLGFAMALVSGAAIGLASGWAV